MTSAVRQRPRRPAKPAYEVGYKKPPRHSQFKPGQSGNPAGRPKAAKNQQTILRDALHTRITYLEHGVEKKATRIELIILKLVERALRGDLRAIDQILKRVADDEQTPETVAAPAASSREGLDAEDKRVLAEILGTSSGKDET